jgi:iron complex outermembrane receptor protein
MNALKTRETVAVVALAVVLPVAPAMAADGAALEEIVVTARKREENLQEVPDSINAFSAAQIEERRLDRIADAIALTPNVHMVNDQDAGTNIITVRGIGTNRNLPASVAYVVDGVILPDSDAFSADLADVERIEVLKGPQGGLYGRNAIGGVINLTTKRPTNEFEADIKAGYGNGDTVDVFAAAGGALIPDTLLARAMVKYYDTDGWIRNRFTGDDLDRDESVKVTGRVIWQPTEALSFDLRASYYDQDTSALWFSPVNVLDTTGGRITEDLADVEPNQNDDAYSEREIFDIALVAELETDLGTFMSISAYDEIDVEFLEDLDITPLTVTDDATQTRRTEGFSQELRFTSPADRRLRYIVGTYYQNTERDVATSVSLDFCFLVPLPFCPTPPGVESGILVPLNLNTTSGEFDQWAVFAQANYDLTDALELTFALRYDEDKRKQLDLLTGRRDSATFDDLQPKVSLAWQATDDVMLYATYAEGYKSGAFNPPPGPGAFFPLVVQQEGTDSYEIGIKSTWLDGRLLANAALYYTDYTNAQVFQLDLTTGGQVAFNARESELKGGEIELAALPIEGFEFTTSFGYNEAEFEDFDGTGLFDGNWLPNTPRYNLNVGGRYEHPLATGMKLVGRVDYHRNGRIYFAQDNFVYQPSYHTVDLQLGVEGDRWTVTLWGENVFDQDYATSAYSRFISPLIFGALLIDPVQIDPGAKYGVQVRWSF